MSNGDEKTLKLVTNLDRSAIEARLAEVRKAAQSGNLPDLVPALTDKTQHKGLFAQLELIELNLPNLK